VNHLKFLYDAFLPKYYWTEVMECLRKLLLTGFVVFFYEGSILQIFTSMIISMIFLLIYNNIKPYLMPSNNTFAIFVHFQVTFTLACSLLLRMFDVFSESDQNSLNFNSSSLSKALLISNVSVLCLGAIMILRSCFITSEGDFLDTGFNKNEEDELLKIQSKDEEEIEEPIFVKDISPQKEVLIPQDKKPDNSHDAKDTKKKVKKKKKKKKKSKQTDLKV